MLRNVRRACKSFAYGVFDSNDQSMMVILDEQLKQQLMFQRWIH